MTIWLLLKILFAGIFLLLAIFYGLVLFAIRRAVHSTKIPVPLVWKFLIFFTALLLIITLLAIIFKR